MVSLSKAIKAVTQQANIRELKSLLKKALRKDPVKE